MKECIYVAHDIEKAGAYIIQNPIVSLGFYIGDDMGNLLQTVKFNFIAKWYQTAITQITENEEILKVTDYGDFEPSCVQNFWLKLDPIIKARCFEPEPLEPFLGWTAVSHFLQSLEDKYPDDKYNIIFLTDNPSFDTASIDYALEKYVGRLPMRYSSTGKYRLIIAADDAFDMLPSKYRNNAQKKIKKIVKSDHDPVNDAHYIYLKYIMAKNMPKDIVMS